MSHLTRRVRSLIAALALLVAAAALAACGGSGSGDSATKVLDDTFSGGKHVRSGRLAANLNFDLKGAQQANGPIALKLTGPFQSQGSGAVPKFDLALTAAVSGQNLSAGAVSTGDKAFLRFQGQTYAVPDQVFQKFKQGFEQAQKSAGNNKTTFATLGIDPRKWLKDPQNKGTEEVGGTDAIHVSSQIDVPKFLDDLNGILGKASTLGAGTNAKLTPAQRDQIAKAIKQATVDVWSGKDDKLLRRMIVKVSFDVPASQRQSAGGLTSGDVTFDLVLTDLNQAQTISPPTGARPLSQLGPELRKLLGATGSSGSGSNGSSGSSGSSSGSSGGGFDQYSQCLSAAGSDIAKAQKCADLLK
jgi:hypothetical protein